MSIATPPVGSLRYQGSVAIVPVRLFPPKGPPFEIRAILDSGADGSVFDAQFAGRLGIGDLTAGREVDVEVANGQKVPGHQFNVELEFQGHRRTVPVTFWTERANVLGMNGFFDQFFIGFRHSAHIVHYVPEP